MGKISDKIYGALFGNDVPDNTYIPERDPKSYADLRKIITEIGVEIMDADDKAFRIAYQGGVFDIILLDGHYYADLRYEILSGFDFKNLYVAYQTANAIALKYAWWMCQFRPEFEGDNPPITVTLSYQLSLLGNSDMLSEIIIEALNAAFSISRDFIAIYKKSLENVPVDVKAMLENCDFNKKVAAVVNRMEIGKNGDACDGSKPREWLSVTDLQAPFENTDWGCAESLRIVAGTECELIENVAEIMKFNVADYILKNHNTKDLSDVMMCVRFEKATLMLFLTRKGGSSEKFMFYRGTLKRILLDECFERTADMETKDFFFGVRIAAADDEYWEARYMIGEAREALKDTGSEDLTDLQRMILSKTDASLLFDMYWAERFYNDGCKYQSLFYFNRVYAYLRDNFMQMKSENRVLYYDVAFYIGMIYMALGLADKAYFYLDAAKQSGKLIHIQEYINCLCVVKSLEAVDFIRDFRFRLLEEITFGGSENVDYNNLYTFVNRRMMQAWINIKNYDEAEEDLKGMISRDQDTDFAKDMLERIDKLRGEPLHTGPYGNGE